MSTVDVGIKRERPVARARVAEIHPDRLDIELDDGRVCPCLCVAGLLARASQLRPGDEVLVVPPAGDDDHGVVIDVIVPFDGTGETHTIKVDGELIVEAGTRLELRVGENRLVITRDGRVLLRGKDIVSRASRRNRIKGGSVSIN